MPGLRVVPIVCSRAARGADIVTTITADKANATIVTPDMIEPGVPERGGRRLPWQDRAAPRCAARRKDLCGIRAGKPIEGDMQQLPPTTPSPSCGACWQPGRQAPVGHDVTVFDSVGFALEDYATLRYIHQRATAETWA